MKIKLFSKCDCNNDGYECGGYDYIIFESKWFRFRWFNDNGAVFLYVHIRKKYWRWSW
jgi:hypothetical protein